MMNHNLVILSLLILVTLVLSDPMPILKPMEAPEWKSTYMISSIDPSMEPSIEPSEEPTVKPPGGQVCFQCPYDDFVTDADFVCTVNCK